MSPRSLDPSDRRAPPSAPEPPSGSNQRRHPRLRLGARCWLADAEHTVYLRVHDVSRGGLSVRAPVPFSPRETVDVELELPGGAVVRARAEIVWVSPADQPPPRPEWPRMGARFLELLEGEEALAEALARA
jgi:hypothetical protein